MKLVHLPLMGGLLHLVQRRGELAGPQLVQAPPRCTKCDSVPINAQVYDHHHHHHHGGNLIRRQLTMLTGANNVKN